MTDEIITSTQNPKIKRLKWLQQKSQYRRNEGVFVVEGQREVERCINAGYEVDALWVCPDILGATAAADVLTRRIAQHQPPLRPRLVSHNVYQTIAYRDDTEGIMAEVKVRTICLDDIAFKGQPLVVVLESVEKPGNLGAILRSADAAGADAVIVCDPLTDLFNPNLIRASVGAAFSVPTVACTSAKCIQWLQEKGIRILTAQLQDSQPYYSTNMRTGIAIVMGTEATGLTPIWRKTAYSHIRIPMLGAVDSLNVSVSTAILLFEAVRQRQTEGC